MAARRATIGTMDDADGAGSGRWTGQGMRYLVSGAAQFVLDWCVFAALHALTGAIVAPNVAGRVAGALLGFAINSRWTFGGAPLLHAPRWRRFMVFWLAQTVASTLLLRAAAHALPAGAVYVAKPAVEVLMAVLGFVAWRAWIRHAR